MAHRSGVRLASLAAFMALTSPAEAQSGAPTGSPPDTSAGPAAPARCSSGRAAALSELACEAKQALGRLPAGAMLVSAPLAADAKPRAAAELSARIASVLGGALSAKVSTEPASLSRARTLAAASGTLVYVAPEIARGELRVTLDVYPVPRNFWDRVRDPEPNPSAHTFVSRRIDAELRTFFPPVPLIAKNVDKASTNEPSPLALACGDIDADGALELVLVGRTRIQLGRIRSGRFVALATASWAQLSPLSRAPLREPVGSAWLEPGQHVDVGISDRLDAVRLDGQFRLLGKLGRRLPWPAGGCAKIQGTSVRPEVDPCLAGDATPATSRMDRPADALAGARVLTTAGLARNVRVQSVYNEATLLAKDDTGRSAELAGVGAQIAVGDVDGDGQPEIITGSDTLDPAGDAILIHTWLDDGSITERARIAVPTPVRALAVCPAESTGLAPIAMATTGGLWLLR